MEKNIFEGAYLGKAYKTRNGRKAIYIYYGSDVNLPFIERHHLIYEGLNSIQTSNYEEIVSEWTEEVDENELNKLADEYADHAEMTGTSSDGYYTGCWDYLDIVKAFKAGYCKAKEK